MTVTQFNEKWFKYIETGHYGLDIPEQNVIDYLDKEFEKEILVNPSFNFAQIKLKFMMARVYAESPNCDKWEKEIDRILRPYLNNIK